MGTKGAVHLALGRLVATPGALAALKERGRGPQEFVERHVAGDWGDVGEDDWRANELALQRDQRLFSSYRVDASLTVWIITEADRSATTVLLPSEY